MLFVAFVAFVALGACDRSPAPAVTADPPLPVTFVGSGRCGDCHAAAAEAWRGSQHRVAMQPATRESVLADFAGETHRYSGFTTTFSERDGRFFVRTNGPEDTLADFAIGYTFGIAPLQQYLVELPGGRWQALGHAWDTRPAAAGGQRWFHLYPGDALRAGDPLHWTGMQQNWNFMCADCHATDLRKNYDVAARRYTTAWSELGVGCEACHGPGSNHVAWAELPEDRRGRDPRRGLAPALTERQGVSWVRDPLTAQPVRSTPRTSSVEIEVCARCHSRRSQLTDAVTAADRFHDGFRASLIESGLYYADGQMRDEVFNYGSFLQSRMHAAGVTCGDCHDPHSGAMRAPGDMVCLQCHDGPKYTAASHHFHAPDSDGSRCAACHMPTRIYMIVDPRHDHSFRIPRPDVSASVGSPDACTDCHQERSRDWAAAEIRKRFPEPATGFQQFATAFARLERGDAGAASAVAAIAIAATQPAIVRASAWERLSDHPQAIDPAALAHALGDDDPLVRRGAATAAGAIDPQARARLLAPLLSDPIRSVRIEAVGQLLDIAPDRLPADAFRQAAAEYAAVQRFSGERPEAQVNLGGLLVAQGEFDPAVAAYREALALDPAYLPAYVNLADLYRARGDEASVEATLREALPHSAGSGAAHFALGLSIVRQGRADEAIDWLRQAARREPGSARFAYVLAIALHDTGSPAQALAELERALALHPDDAQLRDLMAAYRRN